MMKKLNSFAFTAAKVLEVGHWLATAAAAVLLVLSLAAKDRLAAFLSDAGRAFGPRACVYGFELAAANPEGILTPASVTLFSIGAVVIFSLMAMVFRNVCLIFRTSQGKTWFAKGDTPFQKDIVRMVREIGIFCISVPAVGLVMSVIARLALGTEALEMSVNLSGFITGILILCLSQVFAYGVQLQKDEDGLL